jgi:hypothetical protein
LINKWINDNWKLLEITSKKVLHNRWREGISEYYLYLIKRGSIPPNPERHFYYFMVNLNKSSSAINYTPKTLKGGDLDYEFGDDNYSERKGDMMLDLDDEVAVDFLLNNENNERWLKIYDLVFRGGLEMDLFERILFQYIFLDGLSIRDIVKITGNSQDYIYKQRRALIERIKEKI